MKYRIVTLSPIHIGNGNKISPIEYVADGKFHRINMDELFMDEKFDIDGFLEDTKMGSFYLGERYGGIAKRHTLYSIDASNDAMNYIRLRKPEILEFIKTGGKPYIPGSSIKGAIRTAIMWYILKEDKELHLEFIKYIRRILQNKESRPDKKYVADEIEKKIFGKDPNHDAMRLMQISDTPPLDFNSLKVGNVHILSTRRVGYGEKKFNLIVEIIRENSIAPIEIKIDEFLERDDIVKELKFSTNLIECIKNFGEICNEYARDLIKYEINFFRMIDDGKLKRVIDFYQNLYDETNKNAILLRVAWGTGWHGMTVGRLLDDDILERLRRTYNLGRRRDEQYFVKPFPKTRKVIFENGVAKYPLGWVKMEEIG